MVEVVFTEEDRKNLRVLTEELPRLRLLLEELIETLEVQDDEELMGSLKASEAGGFRCPRVGGSPTAKTHTPTGWRQTDTSAREGVGSADVFLACGDGLNRLV